MKKITLATVMLVTGLVMIFDANATDPNYDTTTGIVFMPRVTVNNKDAYINVELLLNPDDTYRILTATPESQAKSYAIGGQGPAGGIVFYITDGGIHGLEAAPEDQAASADWGCYNTAIDGADGFKVGTGRQNTTDILAQCTEVGIAAQFANDYTLEGYNGWFLPSIEELKLLYYQRDLVGGFTHDNYWSSTENSSFYAWLQNFGSGGQTYSTKNATLNVRAVRAF